VKPLFFHAVAGHPRVGPALMGQAGNTLRPFNQYLRQAVHTAKKRQFRYKLPWARVRHQRTLGLNAQDTWLVVAKPEPGWLITNWPDERIPDTAQAMMVVNRGLTPSVVDWKRTDEGLQVTVRAELSSDDQVYWCGHSCELSALSEATRPREVRDGAGKHYPIRKILDGADDSWRVLVEGRIPEDQDILIDGADERPERLQPLAGLDKLFDTSGGVWPLSSGLLKVEELPADRVLTGDNDVRYAWYSRDKKGRQGLWVQLLPSEESSTDEFLDPRAAFCEDQVREVWTGPRRYDSKIIRVKRVDRDRYQLLLEELPPADSLLHLPLNVRNLELQRRALSQLSTAPLPHHQGLLRLCEDPGKARWPRPSPSVPATWHVLTDESRSGTDQQRSFVAAALGHLGTQVHPGEGDVTLLEGPPGSGKTTAICELVLQLVERGKRVLLCGSTHYSIDNVLERILDDEFPVDAVRIGRLERVDRKVQETQLDNRVDALADAWRGAPGFEKLGSGELKEMAERTVVMSADLTCGTTMGIVNHPLFGDRDPDLKRWERPISRLPWWDVLIVDEASKTTIQEFLVPALMARRWIIVGDVRQLPPFADRADITANLRSLVDDRDKEVFPVDHQRARLLAWHLGRPAVRRAGARFLVAEPPGVLDWLERELAGDDRVPAVVRVVAGKARGVKGGVPRVTTAQITNGAPEALHLAAADWVLVQDDLLEGISGHLPADLLESRDLGLSGSDRWRFRHGHWLSGARPLRQPVRTRDRRRGDCATPRDLERHEVDWLSRKDWAGEVTWRLTRVHELRRSQRQDERERYKKAIARLAPKAVDISGAIEEISDIGLPSVLEVVQEGIGEDRSNRRSALTQGLRAGRSDVFARRFGSLKWQHRMHADISAFPREMFYVQEALQDANTIEERDSGLDWDFAPQLPARRVWVDVRGVESRGENSREVEGMAAILRRFLAWAERHGPPRRSRPAKWEVACLAFYVKQEGAIRRMLRELTGDDRQTRFSDGRVEIVCGTVDRFQGREADLVLLSMRNTGRVGFLDSVNRLNVAVTRARQQLVILGNADYFGQCRISELEELVRRSPVVDQRRWPGRAGTRRGR